MPFASAAAAATAAILCWVSLLPLFRSSFAWCAVEACGFVCFISWNFEACVSLSLAALVVFVVCLSGKRRRWLDWCT